MLQNLYNKPLLQPFSPPPHSLLPPTLYPSFYPHAYSFTTLHSLLSFSHISSLTWQEIHHKHYPQKIQDLLLLWKLSHHSLPIGISIANISPHFSFCPWCPTTNNTISHLFANCHIA